MKIDGYAVLAVNESGDKAVVKDRLCNNVKLEQNIQLSDMNKESYLNESQLDEIVREYVTKPTNEEERRVKMMVLSLVSDLRNCRGELEQVKKERDWYKEQTELLLDKL